VNKIDTICADIGRKCASDVSSTVHRNISLMDDTRGAMIVAMYGAAAAFGAATGSMGAFLGRDGDITPEIVDEMWTAFIRPMILGELAKDTPDE
jgi:hypothetical protein